MNADKQPIYLYDTLRREKVKFDPIDPDNVRMYVCGPTVYDFAHIGNARPIIVFDVLYRLLLHKFPGESKKRPGNKRVTYARNITDVDDKINARAAEEHSELPLNDAIAEVTTRTTAQFHADIKALGVLEPTVEPRCTGHIGEMVTMIETLIAKDCAYAAEGHVLLDTTNVPDYGKLSGRSLDEMIAGARVEVAPYKRNPADSVLWRPSTVALLGWGSPWSRGRPGWHIECSAMAEKILGAVFDIHGGGIDLAFPHHENELAQSRAAHGTDRMANIWMHNGFLQVEGEKMSKSLGNFVTINELLATDNFGDFEWPGAVLRFAMLMTHYRQPIDWTVNRLEKASIALDSFRHFSFDDEEASPSQEIIDALADDLNTPRVVAELHRLLAASKTTFGSTVFEAVAPAKVLRASCRFLGLDVEEVNFQKAARASLDIDKNRIDALIREREDARAAKDFARSDQIRDQLAAEGIQLKDGKDAASGLPVTTWEVKR